MSTPQFSIVVATYNRPDVLRCAIESVRRQSRQDWELFVVGDACTERTAEVVAAFDDDRIRYVNLTTNCGEQAGPNNFGISLARAPYTCFLNHDDLWFEDHLALLAEAVEVEQADLVHSIGISIGADSPVPFDWSELRLALVGVGRGRPWRPTSPDSMVVPASTWLVRTSMLRQLRGWRLARDCVVEPSQDLVFRCWKAGGHIRTVLVPTVLIVASGYRPGSYLESASDEQAWLLERLGDPGLRAELVSRALETNEAFVARSDTPRTRLQRLGDRVLAAVGIDPRAALMLKRGHRPGTYLQAVRQMRGLPSAPWDDSGAALRAAVASSSCDIALWELIDFRAGRGGARFLSRGWSRPDADGTWNDGTVAELLVRLPEPPGVEVVADLQLRPFLGGNEVSLVDVGFGGDPIERWELDAIDGWRRYLHIPTSAWRGRTLTIRFDFLNPRSPATDGTSDDERLLAMALIYARFEPAAD